MLGKLREWFERHLLAAYTEGWDECARFLGQGDLTVDDYKSMADRRDSYVAMQLHREL